MRGKEQEVRRLETSRRFAGLAEPSHERIVEAVAESAECHEAEQ